MKTRKTTRTKNMITSMRNFKFKITSFLSQNLDPVVKIYSIIAAAAGTDCFFIGGFVFFFTVL